MGTSFCYPMQDPDSLAAQINELATSGDLVMCLGAGTITQWASSLPQELALRGAKPPAKGGQRNEHAPR